MVIIVGLRGRSRPLAIGESEDNRQISGHGTVKAMTTEEDNRRVARRETQ